MPVAITPITVEDTERLELKYSVMIRLNNTRYLTSADMEMNAMTADLLREEPLVDGKREVDQSTLPEQAKAFHNMLVARMKIKKFAMQATTAQMDVSPMVSPSTLASVPATPLLNALDRKAFNLITILEEEFTNHFEEVEGYTMNSQHVCILGSYVNILVRYEGRENGFISDYSTMAKEVSLTGILADPAIDNIPWGYSRDRRTLTSVVDYHGTIIKWEPREDFCVAHGSGTARYALLNGGTDPTGESEAEARHKMSVVSKYSHGIIRQLTKKDTVILSSYVSERICKMYLFYRLSGVNDVSTRKTECMTTPDKIIFLEICHARDPQLHYVFDHPSQGVGFLRRLHNFAAYARPLIEGLPPAQALKRGILEGLGGDLPSAKTSGPKDRSKREKKTESSHTGGENPPLKPTTV
ncbi:hypothetical protein FRB94_009456 [Tulasnella sp. JGI-2019a]|nr:hypothetical protein FRB94_009456 [Tulasnella sp. JGI-2019a]